MLATVTSIAQGLKEKFGRAEFDLSDLCLLEPGVSATTIQAAEDQLEVKLPSDMAQLLMRFDFSRLSLANLAFYYGEGLEKFTASNLGHPLPWWGTEARPSNLLLVATTDGHAVFLSIKEGRIFATEKDAPRPKKEIPLANGFEELVRIAGTIALGGSQKGRMEIAASLDLGPFWAKLAAGTA